MSIIKTITATAMFCFAAFVHAEVNINTATVQQLTELNNIGVVKAVAIVEYRNDHGHFQSIDDLLKVDGIGMAILEENRNMLTIGISHYPTLPMEKPMPVEGRVTQEMHAPAIVKEN